MKKICVLFIILILNPSNILFPNTQSKTTIAVFDMQSSLVPENVLTAMNNQLRHELKNSNLFIILDKEKVRQNIDDEKERLTEHQDETYLVKVGELLGAEEIFAADMRRDANSLVITIHIFNIGEKQIEKIFTQTYGGAIDGLISQIDILASEIIQWETNRLFADMDQDTKKLDQSEYDKQKIIVRRTKKNKNGWQAYKGRKKISPYEFFKIAGFEYEVREIEESKLEVKDKKTLAWILNVLGTGFVLYGTAYHNPNEIDRTKETLFGVASISAGVYMLAHAADHTVRFPLRIAKQAAESYNKKLTLQLMK